MFQAEESEGLSLVLSRVSGAERKGVWVEVDQLRYERGESVKVEANHFSHPITPFLLAARVRTFCCTRSAFSPHSVSAFMIICDNQLQIAMNFPLTVCGS